MAGQLMMVQALVGETSALEESGGGGGGWAGGAQGAAAVRRGLLDLE